MTGFIRRQGETHVPGPHPIGPAPTPHQVREVTLQIESLGPGKVRVSTPQARGWAAVATNPFELTRAVNAAFTEAQIASHSTWKNQVYDLDGLTEVDPNDPKTALNQRRPRRQRGPIRSDIHHPGDWQRLEDGRWRSPGGRIYREETQLVQRMIENRRLIGMDEPPL